MIPISVCVPMYNGSAYLGACLDSILRQTFSNFEVIVVDDQSLDESYDIAKRYAAEDGRVHVFQNVRNLGLVGNWNRCVELSRGEWIKFVFQDDLLESQCLERMVGAADPAKGIIACRRNIVYEGIDDEFRQLFDKFAHLKSIETIFEGRTDISPDEFCNRVMDHPGFNFVGEPTAVMLHRDMFSRFGKFNPLFIQLCDLEFWARICCNRGLTYIPETLATFRLHGQGASLINRDKQIFRTTVLEFVLLYYEFAYNPMFERLRVNAGQRFPKRNLVALATLERIRAMELAKDINKKNPGSHDSSMDEIDTLLERYPRVDTLPYYRWLKTISPVIKYRRVLNFIYKRIFSKVPFEVRV